MQFKHSREREGLGEGGERLHEWIFGLESWRAMHHREGDERNADSDMLAEGLAATGAIIVGKRMFGGWDGPWGDEPTLGVWGGKDVSVGGGANVIQQYMAAGRT